MEGVAVSDDCIVADTETPLTVWNNWRASSSSLSFSFVSSSELLLLLLSVSFDGTDAGTVALWIGTKFDVDSESKSSFYSPVLCAP